MRIRGKNPVYRFDNYNQGYAQSNVDSASYSGVALKAFYMLAVVATVALYFAYRLQITESNLGSMFLLMIAAPIIAIIMVVLTHRNPRIAPITTTIYAAAEGLFLGFISAFYAAYAGGEVVQMALVATFGVLGGMLFLYNTGIIRVGNFFRRVMYGALIGLVIASLIVMILSLTGISEGLFYSFYSVIVVAGVVISSLYLLIDFDQIKNYVDSGAPKELEWGLALGLVVTIVWLYVELLRFIALIANRN